MAEFGSWEMSRRIIDFQWLEMQCSMQGGVPLTEKCCLSKSLLDRVFGKGAPDKAFSGEVSEEIPLSSASYEETYLRKPCRRASFPNI